MIGLNKATATKIINEYEEF